MIRWVRLWIRTRRQKSIRRLRTVAWDSEQQQHEVDELQHVYETATSYTPTIPTSQAIIQACSVQKRGASGAVALADLSDWGRGADVRREKMTANASSRSRDHEDGGPTIQIQQRTSRCTLDS
jgi:hypothetical protein